MGVYYLESSGCWVADVKVCGTRKRKCFYTSKYGKEEARNLALMKQDEFLLERGTPVRVRNGRTKEALYDKYSAMLERCSGGSNNPRYECYRTKGIKVCCEWKKSYLVFKAWALISGYEDGLSIERLDNNKDYTPDNCKWVPFNHQSYNKGMCSKNTTGVTGVSYCKGRNSYAGFYNISKKKSVRRYFSIKKYGEEEAFKLATKFREDGLKNLIEKGLPYGINHGM